MAGKVFHVTDNVFYQATAFCQRHGLNRKMWVESLVLQACDEDLSDPKMMTSSAPPKTRKSLQEAKTIIRDRAKKHLRETAQKYKQEKPVPVEKKALPTIPEDENGKDGTFIIYQQPAFWEKKQDAQPTTEQPGKTE